MAPSCAIANVISSLIFHLAPQILYNKAGIKEEGTMFLFTDSQISNERFLVYINDMLASGNIPDLYTQASSRLLRLLTYDQRYV